MPTLPLRIKIEGGKKTRDNNCCGLVRLFFVQNGQNSGSKITQGFDKTQGILTKTQGILAENGGFWAQIWLCMAKFVIFSPK